MQQLEGLAEKYVAVVAQNTALHNEVQDLKGSIRVFCRVRPAGTTGDDSPPCTSASVDGEVCMSHGLEAKLTMCFPTSTCFHVQPAVAFVHAVAVSVSLR